LSTSYDNTARVWSIYNNNDSCLRILQVFVQSLESFEKFQENIDNNHNITDHSIELLFRDTRRL